MPIRIKPTIELGRCQIDLDGIKKIIDLMNKEFSKVVYKADDDVWEIYLAKAEEFYEAIKTRDKLDSIIIEAELYVDKKHTLIDESSITELDVEMQFLEKSMKVVFSAEEASISLSASPEEESWFEHFIIDIEKCFMPLNRIEKTIWSKIGVYYIWPIVEMTTGINYFRPYCVITIKKKLPNPMIENIKANLISNIIWWLLTLVSGGAITFLTLWWTGKLK